MLIRGLPQQTQNFCITGIKCWPNVEDGPTLYTYYAHMFCVCWDFDSAARSIVRTGTVGYLVNICQTFTLEWLA